MAKIESANTYCYDIVASKICKGVEKTLLTGKECAGAITINNWSPNNIRRLVISADGILVQYYTTAKNSKLLDIALFENPTKLSECYATENYKPMVKALHDIRVCSCIEEIIYLTKPNKWGIFLPMEELNIKKYSNSFKRLHGRVVLQMNLQEFYTKYKSELVKPDFQVCDANIPNAKVELVVKEWWNYYPLRPVYYNLDAEDNKLEKYFSKVKEDIEKSKQDKQVKDVKKKYLGDSVEKLIKADDRLAYAIKGALKYQSLLKNQDKLYAFVSKEFIEPLTLIKNIQYELYSKKLVLGDFKEISEQNKSILSRCNVSFIAIDNYDGSEADLYAQTKDTLDIITMLTYKCICEYMLDCAGTIAEEASLTVRYLLRGIERVILVPKQLEQKAYKLENLCDLVFNGKDTKHSICNCLLVCCLLVFKDGENYNKDYWLKGVGGDK